MDTLNFLVSKQGITFFFLMKSMAQVYSKGLSVSVYELLKLIH